MKKRYFCVFILIFLLVGEVLVRIDQSFDVLNEKPKVAIAFQESVLKKQLDTNVFTLKEDQIRIMVLGDSFFFGAGIHPKFKISNVIKEKLESFFNQEVLVLDLSRPSNNTLDNYTFFRHYSEIFKPNYVILGYNFNDILGDLTLEKSQLKLENKTNIQPNLVTIKKDNSLKALSKKIYNTSELTRFLSKKIQKELKLRGYVLPFGEFYSLTHSFYAENGKRWQESAKIFDNMIAQCQKNNINFLIYNLPEFNLLKNKDLFVNVNSTINGYFKDKEGIIFINDISDFKDEDNYMISKYDGHPNKKAHEVISKRIVKELMRDSLFLKFEK